MKILVVDDDKKIRELFSEALTKHGYDVITAENGLEALGLAMADAPALILMDLDMPKMNGFAATRQIKARPETTMISSIMLTGCRLVENVRQALSAGATDIIVKSDLNMEYLLEKIRKAIHA